MLKTKKILSILLALIMVLTIMPLGVITSFASDAFALIGDKRYDLKFDKLPMGVTYDGVNNEIILENASLPSLCVEKSITIRLKGKNSIFSYSPPITIAGKTVHAGMYVIGDLTIVSNEGGSLNISLSDTVSASTAEYNGIYVPNGRVLF